LHFGHPVADHPLLKLHNQGRGQGLTLLTQLGDPGLKGSPGRALVGPKKSPESLEERKKKRENKNKIQVINKDL
jgi:hypothetical protein